MPAGKGIDVAAVAQTILDGVTAHYQAAPDIRLPDRRYIAPGSAELVAWDCECLIVTCGGIAQGPAPGAGVQTFKSGRQTSSSGVRHATFSAQVVRKTPESTGVGGPPDPRELTEAGLLMLRDAGLLSQALIDICTAMNGQVGQVQVGDVQIAGPESGFAANIGTIAVTVGTLI